MGFYKPIYICTEEWSIIVKNNFMIAFSGIIVALSLISMFLAGIFPYAEYTFPAISGVLLVPIVIHFGYRYSFIAFFAIAILSLILTPNKESAILFCGFLGYYPILKSIFERIKNIIFSFAAKIIIFNIAITISYFVLINIFSMTELLSDFNFITYGVYVLLILANVVFIIYDLALTRLISYYVQIIAPKYFNKYF